MRTIVLLAPLALIACERNELRTGAPVPGGRMATAAMVTATGQPVGRATATEVAGGVRVTLDARGLTPGVHGAHLHTVGRCDAPDFASAGPHWNPANTKHGTLNPQGPHAGDLPNLTIGPDGRGTLAITLAGATLAGMLDADGTAMIVHTAADDLVTDPSGNSGGRVACGALAAG
jgi:superoxide dismutase, Cu-Zn family